MTALDRMQTPWYTNNHLSNQNLSETTQSLARFSKTIFFHIWWKVCLERFISKICYGSRTFAANSGGSGGTRKGCVYKEKVACTYQWELHEKALFDKEFFMWVSSVEQTERNFTPHLTRKPKWIFKRHITQESLRDITQNHKHIFKKHHAEFGRPGMLICQQMFPVHLAQVSAQELVKHWGCHRQWQSLKWECSRGAKNKGKITRARKRQTTAGDGEAIVERACWDGARMYGVVKCREGWE